MRKFICIGILLLAVSALVLSGCRGGSEESSATATKSSEADFDFE